MNGAGRLVVAANANAAEAQAWIGACMRAVGGVRRKPTPARVCETHPRPAKFTQFRKQTTLKIAGGNGVATHPALSLPTQLALS